MSTQAGESKRDRAIRYFMSQGWTREQAIGIAANLQHESNFDERAQGDKNKRTGQYDAYGIAQWHPDRQREFKRVFDKDIREASYEEQLAFVQHELTTTHKAAGDALRKTRTARDAGAAVTLQYEIPANKEARAVERGNTAQSIAGDYAAYTASAMPSAAGAASTTNNSRTVTANIGEINVQTQATDAQGIAADIGAAMNDTLVSQANYGTF